MENIGCGIGALYKLLARDSQFTSTSSQPSWQVSKLSPHQPGPWYRALGERLKVYLLITLCSSQSDLLGDYGFSWGSSPQTDCAVGDTPPFTPSLTNKAFSPSTACPETFVCHWPLPALLIPLLLGCRGSTLPAWWWVKSMASIQAILHCGRDSVNPGSPVRSGPWGSTE